MEDFHMSPCEEDQQHTHIHVHTQLGLTGSILIREVSLFHGRNNLIACLYILII